MRIILIKSCLFIILSFFVTIALAEDLWVDAINGDDNQTGLTATTALKTLQAAADRATPGAIVHIQPGIYRETITPAQNGSANAPVTYRAEQGANTVMIRGSESANSLTWTPLTENTLGLPATVDFTKIVWADLSAWNLTEMPRFVVDTTNDTGQRLTLAREPDWQVQTDWKQHEFWWTAEGGATVAKCDPPTDKDRRNCDKASRSTTQLIDNKDSASPVEVGNLTTLGDLTGATLVSLDTFQGNYLFRRIITAHEVNAGKITIDRPAERASTTNSAGLGWGSQFYVENHPALLDTPGEYWFDKETNRLYVFPPSTDLKTLEISTRDNGWLLTNRSYLVLQDLTLEFFNGNALTINNNTQQSSQHLQFQQLQIRYADEGLAVAQSLSTDSPKTAGISNLTLENSVFNDLDTQAIDFSSEWGNATFSRPSITQIVVKNNIFHHLGFHSRLDEGAGISVNYPDNFIFENNVVHHVASNGIRFDRSVIQSDKSFGFEPTEIKTGTILLKDNVIEKTCLVLTVCSGIRFSGTAPDSHVFKDVLITGNTIRYIFGWAYASEKRAWWASGRGGYGLFFDGTSGIQVYRNVFYSNGWANAMFVGEWRDGEIFIFNNVLADAHLGLNLWNSAEVSARQPMNTQIQYNLIVNNERYGIEHIFDPTLNEPQFISDHNLYYANGWGKNGGVIKDANQAYTTLAEAQTTTPWEANSVDDNPLFVRYDYQLEQSLDEQDNVDFHLRQESAARQQEIMFLPLALQTLIDQFALEKNFIQNLGPFEHFYTQGLAMAVDNSFVETETYFSSVITTESGQQGDELVVTPTEKLTITTELLVDAAHVGQPASLVMVGGYTPPSALQPLYYTRQGAEWRAWDGQLSTLAIAEAVDSLSDQQRVMVYQGNFAGLLGDFVVYVGYQLPNGIVVFNGQRTTHFTVHSP